MSWIQDHASWLMVGFGIAWFFGMMAFVKAMASYELPIVENHPPKEHRIRQRLGKSK